MINIVTNWVISHNDGINSLINTLIQSIFFTLGLALWNKIKFPFSWRRVWSIFFLVLSTAWFFGLFIYCMKKME
jgi:hypothetical protein